MLILIPLSVGIKPELEEILTLSMSLLLQANTRLDKNNKTAILLIIPVPIEPTICKIDSKHQFKIVFLNLLIARIASFDKLNANI